MKLDAVIKKELNRIYGYLLWDIHDRLNSGDSGTSHHLDEAETVAIVLLSVLKKGGVVPPETCLPFNAEVSTIMRHLKAANTAITGRAIACEWRRIHESTDRVLYRPVFRGIRL